ncbi:MAG: hypothetical protein JSU01_09810 [Bacteroidetes bacterium]|nr:hypothetical protein [Bacteroidota bacterium]
MQLKRLSSYIVYLIFAMPLVVIIGAPFAVMYEGMPWAATFIFVLPLGFWGYFISKSKRVYYQDNSLYAYDLFSNNHRVITKDQLGSIERWSMVNDLISQRLSNAYRILYYDENNNDKKIYFYGNWFLSDFNTIIDQLNEIN